MTGSSLSGAGGKPTAPSPTGDSAPQKVEKAKLTMYESSPATGGRKLDAEIGTIEFQFNPKELTIAKKAKWESKSTNGAKAAPPPEFKGSARHGATTHDFGRYGSAYTLAAV